MRAGLAAAAALLTLAVLAGLCAHAQVSRVAIVHVSVVDVEGGSTLPDRTVLVTGGRITAVGPAASVRVPVGAQVIEGRGRFLIPGLWDMHVHTSREGRAKWFFPLFLAHGVTGVREMGSYRDSLLYWRRQVQSGAIQAPRVTWSTPMLDGVPPSWAHGLGVASPAAARALVDSLKAQGFDFLKVYDRLPRDVFLAIADQAKRRGIPFAGHVPQSVTPAEASDAGQRTVEHVTENLYLACLPGGQELLAGLLAARAATPPDTAGVRQARDRLREAAARGPTADACRPTFARFVANGTWLTPTLAVTHGSLAAGEAGADPRLRFVPPALAERWRANAPPPDEVAFRRMIEANNWRLVAMARAQGVGILAGTDASDEAFVFAGSSLHDELALLVRAGLSPLDALRAATINPARALGRPDGGSIAPGKRADLVLLDADPLADIRSTARIHTVIAAGRVIGPAERAALLRTAEREAARAQVAPPARQ
jgi:hypothetical protein